MKFSSFLLFSVSLLFFSCGNEKKVSEETTAKKDSLVRSIPPPLNPNGDSELALLMREMAATTQKIQEGLKNNTEIPPYPESFGRIYFAKKTDSTLNKDLFNGLANNYLNSVKYFFDGLKKSEKNLSADKQDIPEKEKIIRYNAMVNSCIGCHNNFCGGPIKRIKKLLLAE